MLKVKVRIECDRGDDCAWKSRPDDPMDGILVYEPYAIEDYFPVGRDGRINPIPDGWEPLHAHAHELPPHPLKCKHCVALEKDPNYWDERRRERKYPYVRGPDE